MDKSCQSSAPDSHSSSSSIPISTSSASTHNTRDHNNNQYLRHLNKLSQKISKPIIKKPSFENPQHHLPPPPPPPPPPPQNPTTFSSQQPPQQNLQHQPPVYNINKNDFRDVVQKLTGSPAHDRFVTPPPIHQPKPPSSRLQRIRPPPLPQIPNRPPPMINAAVSRPQQLPPPPNAVPFNNFTGFGRPLAPLSPLPPFPTVHAPAESPISAYMRDLQNMFSSMDSSSSKQFSGFSPLPASGSGSGSSQALPPQQEQQGMGTVPPQTQPVAPPPALPSSPLPFGCLNSPLSSYPLLSPGLLFSPNSGQLGFPQLPLSPTVPVPSPRWRGI